MRHSSSLSAAAQAAYANVATAAENEALTRGVCSVPGGFVTKRIGSASYWYHQIKQPDGRLVQTYLGRVGTSVDDLVQRSKDPAEAAASEHARRLCSAAIALGCPAIIPNHARVIDRLDAYGFFRAGGILIGSHAFLAYQNMLGVSWRSGASTNDIDFAHPGRNLTVALPQEEATPFARPRDAIESLEMGFVPNHDGTTFIKKDQREFELDFVTSVGRSGDKPVQTSLLDVRLQPLRFMEFAMEHTTRVTLLARTGPILVNVPPPERYAVHKLLVCGERGRGHRIKARKDLEQAATLIEFLSVTDPAALAVAWNDLVSRGEGWRSRAEAGLALLRATHAGLDLAAMLARREAGLDRPRP